LRGVSRADNRHRDAIARQNLTRTNSTPGGSGIDRKATGIGVLRFHQNIDVVCPTVVQLLFDVNFLPRATMLRLSFWPMPGTARKSLAAAPITALAEPKWAISALRSRGPMPGVSARSSSAERRSGRSLRRHMRHCDVCFTQCQRTGNVVRS